MHGQARTHDSAAGDDHDDKEKSDGADGDDDDDDDDDHDDDDSNDDGHNDRHDDNPNLSSCYCRLKLNNQPPSRLSPSKFTAPRYVTSQGIYTSK